MRRTLAALAFAVLVGCGGGGAKDLLDTAELEAVQNNPTHARELYQEIVRRYPDSPEATKARRSRSSRCRTAAPG